VVAGANKDELISERVAVKVGLRQPGKVEILEGLSLGDTVVVAGQQRLQKDGTVVKVVDTSKAQSAGPANAANAAKPGEKPADKAAEKPSDKAIAKAKENAGKPVAGDNPCLRGLNATR
jgi:membrane fusion protein (multidrug efflux system)